MAKARKDISHLKLGSGHTSYPIKYEKKVLECFQNKNPNHDAWISFLCTEFTTLCPKTGQPDFAKITINYIAHKNMVESKSLKLYLFSFRNEGEFHEDCIQKICNDLVSLLRPKYLEVIGEFGPRGGIAIYPYSNYSNSQKKYKLLKDERYKTYAPGKFTMPFGRLY